MDCCSSSNYADYRHHSMNGNFCYPYSPTMLRSASPYAAAALTRTQYGTDYRSSPLGYHGHPHHQQQQQLQHGGYDGYDKYYGSYHHGPASYQTGYYGNYPAAYRDYGSGYGSHYYHQSQSPYARGGPMYGASGSYPYPGRHYPGGSSSLHPVFGSRESYSYHAQREHHQQQQQYSSFANYTHLPPYRNGVGTHDHPGGKSHPTQYPHPHQSFTGSHNERGMMTGSSGSSSEGPPSTTSTTTTSAGHPSPSPYSVPNGYSSPTSDYTLRAGASTYNSSSESPQHPLGTGGGEERDAAAPSRTATPAPSATLLSATAAAAAGAEYPLGTKDTRMRKPKERKLHRPVNGSGDGAGSRPGSPSAAVNGLCGSNGAAATRMKSLDALTSLCWPEDDQFPGRMRKYSSANGLKSREGNNNRKESNELEGASATSPNRTAGPTRRTKKQTSNKQSKETKQSSTESKEKQTNGTAPTTEPSVENKNITPLPGFQQAFGSTEIGKFSEVFFNSSPTSANHSPPSPQHHHHPLQLHQEHQHSPTGQQQSQQLVSHRSEQHGTTMHQLVMESLNTYESDVDTLSPQPQWDSHGAPVDTYDGTPGSTGYGLSIGTTSNFHPSYYESSSYSDHAVDSPLGNYFSEMTCNEFVN